MPIGTDLHYADEKPDAVLELHICPGQDGSFTLYEDEGDNYNYKHGTFATIMRRWEDESRRLILEQRQGSYQGMPDTRIPRRAEKWKGRCPVCQRQQRRDKDYQ